MPDQRGYDVVIAGVGGQGNLLASRLLAHAAMSLGIDVAIAETYGVTQRGGPVHSQVRIGRQVAGALIRGCAADLIIGLEPIEALRRAAEYVKQGGTILVNTVVDLPLASKLGGQPKWDMYGIRRALLELEVGSLVGLNGMEIALKSGGSQTLNVVMTGAACALPGFPLPLEVLMDSIRALLPAKYVEANLASLRAGYAALSAAPGLEKP
ncbi:MAG: indolepyruvate oxidoreductase subunit beta [Dehalococcoidales bacterium]|nr:indolepyruvate oxidoreductase subunit beta [Dehalococcoidales bacterium]